MLMTCLDLAVPARAVPPGTPVMTAARKKGRMP